jgi:sugar phosphate isomerase/epimerase
MPQKGLIGVQMSTIAPNKMPRFDVFESMEKLTGIGYHCIEISQVPMTAENVTGFRRSIDELGMNVASLSAMVEPSPQQPKAEALSNPDHFKKIVDDCKALDCDMLRIGAMPMDARFSYEASLDFAKKADEYACRLKEEGIDLYYHNHHFEFARFNGQFLMDIIRENTKQLGFELDIHWIYRGGLDPVAFINRCAGRIRLLHLKDYRVVPMTVPEGADLSTPEGMAKVYAQMSNIVQFAEVGEGTLDIPACIQAGLNGGSEYFLVEQDMCYGRDPFESLKISHDNLVKMGYGDWF